MSTTVDPLSELYRDVGRFDDAPDRKRGAKLIAAVF
jgi:hypothetical protein